MTYGKLKLAVVTISGFSQKVWKRTGMGDLYWTIRDRYATAPDRFFMHLPWDADFKHEAAKIKLHAADDIRIAVVAYSWGCGNGVRKLAKYLKRLGLSIELLLLIDPVIYRPGFWFSPRQLWALTRLGKFKVLANVDAVYSWRQVNKGPFGRRLKLENRRTTVLGHSVIGSHEKLMKYGSGGQGPKDRIIDPNIDHNKMDDDARVRSMVLSRLEAFVMAEPVL